MTVQFEIYSCNLGNHGSYSKLGIAQSEGADILKRAFTLFRLKKEVDHIFNLMA